MFASPAPSLQARFLTRFGGGGGCARAARYVVYSERSTLNLVLSTAILLAFAQLVLTVARIDISIPPEVSARATGRIPRETAGSKRGAAASLPAPTAASAYRRF